MAKTQSAAETANLVKEAAAANASKTGDADVKLSEQYWGMARYQDALDAGKAGAAKGPTDERTRPNPYRHGLCRSASKRRRGARVQSGVEGRARRRGCRPFVVDLRRAPIDRSAQTVRRKAAGRTAAFLFFAVEIYASAPAPPARRVVRPGPTGDRRACRCRAAWPRPCPVPASAIRRARSPSRRHRCGRSGCADSAPPHTRPACARRRCRSTTRRSRRAPAPLDAMIGIERHAEQPAARLLIAEAAPAHAVAARIGECAGGRVAVVGRDQIARRDCCPRRPAWDRRPAYISHEALASDRAIP